MADFETALEVVLEHEGFGGFTDDPVDHGGATKWGITQGELAMWRNSSVSAGDVRHLGRAEATAIYQKNYWERSGANRIMDQRVATKIFDMAVNLGVMRHGTDAAELVQRAINTCRQSDHLEVDGIIGEKTIAATNLCEPDRLLEALRMEQRHYYLAIIARDPTQERFRVGWLRRAAWPKDKEES